MNAYALDITVRQGREKVKEEFRKHAQIKDIKSIDMMVIKVSNQSLKGHLCGNVAW